MKSKSPVIGLLAAALIFGSITAQEQTQTKPAKTPVVTKRQINQHTRIKQGVKSGQLTKRETKKLGREQAKIQKDKQIAKSDGKVTAKERSKIRREQNKASRDIYRMKHNDKTQK